MDTDKWWTPLELLSAFRCRDAVKSPAVDYGVEDIDPWNGTCKLQQVLLCFFFDHHHFPISDASAHQGKNLKVQFLTHSHAYIYFGKIIMECRHNRKKLGRNETCFSCFNPVGTGYQWTNPGCLGGPHLLLYVLSVCT